MKILENGAVLSEKEPRSFHEWHGALQPHELPKHTESGALLQTNKENDDAESHIV